MYERYSTKPVVGVLCVSKSFLFVLFSFEEALNWLFLLRCGCFTGL